MGWSQEKKPIFSPIRAAWLFALSLPVTERVKHLLKKKKKVRFVVFFLYDRLCCKYLLAEELGYARVKVLRQTLNRRCHVQ